MKYFPWWNEQQKKLADEAKQFTDEVLIPIGSKCAWRKEFPWEAFKYIAEKGWFGAQIPAKYGGRAEEWGVTGACILLEEVARAGEIAMPLVTTMIGGIHQIVHDGTEDQKRKWLPSIAKGELLGSIAMTEPFAGTDAASIETTARLNGDTYIVNGKKRFQTGAGAADLYIVYVKTSDKPEDKSRYRHLTAFVIEKGMPGFTIEKVNDLIGFDGISNCYINFDNVRVPQDHRLGKEGNGWSVMLSGLNVERICTAAIPLGGIRESLRYALHHLQRRVQFDQRTADMPTNQFKIADMIWKYELARLSTYYAAYCADIGLEIALESATAKLFNTNSQLQIAIEAIQCMGGNGVTQYYPVERIFRDSKLMQIAAGTDEAIKLVLYRAGVGSMMDDLEIPLREIDPDLKVPMPLGVSPAKKAFSGEADILSILAEDYRVNPGLHMTLNDIKKQLDIDDEELKRNLIKLEEKGLADLYRDRKGNIVLARATYSGLSRANPIEHYSYIPPWVNKEDLF